MERSDGECGRSPPPSQTHIGVDHVTHDDEMSRLPDRVAAGRRYQSDGSSVPSDRSTAVARTAGTVRGGWGESRSARETVPAAVDTWRPPPPRRREGGFLP